MKQPEHITPEQHNIDLQVVTETLTYIEQRANDTNDTEWHTRHAAATRFVEAMFTEFVPGQLSEQQLAIGTAVGATGLALMDVRFGIDERSPRAYSGSYEKNVLPTYHHGNHARYFMRGGLNYMRAINEQDAIQGRQPTYSSGDFMRMPAIAGFHDSITGNGRGHDERQAALLGGICMSVGLETGARGLALPLPKALDAGIEPDAAVSFAIDATTWDDELKAQSVRSDDPFVALRRATAVPDLGHLFGPANDASGPNQTANLMAEDMQKVGNDRTLSEAAAEQGVTLNSVDTCYAVIDASDAASAKFRTLFSGQAGFYRNFTPADPQLDKIFTRRIEHAEYMQTLNEDLQSGRLTASGILRATRQYALTA